MGKYIKRFNNVNAQTTFINSINYIEPHVSSVVGSNNLKYNAPFVAIQVASSAYIKSSELNKFLEEVIGVHVYSNTTCKTFAADDEYNTIVNGINNYYESLYVEPEEGEEEETEWPIPIFTSFTVENGAISLYTEEEEPEEEVMPADDMDPDSGGGEDIVEDDPVPTDPPLPEEPEIIE